MLRPDTQALWDILQAEKGLGGFILIGGTALQTASPSTSPSRAGPSATLTAIAAGLPVGDEGASVSVCACSAATEPGKIERTAKKKDAAPIRAAPGRHEIDIRCGQ